MKNTFFFVFIILLFVFKTSNCQIDDINKGANKNRNEKKEKKQGLTNPDSNENGASNDNLGKGCADACCDIIGSTFFQILAGAVIEGQKAMLNGAVEDPTIRSVDFMPQFAYNPKYNSYLILPKIRGTYGIFASEFRINFFSGTNKNKSETFKSYEWQILQLNLASIPNLNFRIGTGIYWQYFSSSIPNEGIVLEKFNEHFIELSLKFKDQKYISTFSGRAALDYETSNNIFNEISIIQNNRFLKTKNVSAYYSFGINIQHYYLTSRFLSIQTGLHFNFWNDSPISIKNDENVNPAFD